MPEVNKYPGQLVFGLDIGTRSIVGTVGYKIGEKFYVVAQRVKEHETRAMYDGGFDYWIGCMSDKECPVDLEEMTIPASTWAVFEIIGSMRPLPNAMQDIWKRIYSEWLPNSGYEHAMLPEIEYYSAGDMAASDYRSEIWIPVRK